MRDELVLVFDWGVRMRGWGLLGGVGAVAGGEKGVCWEAEERLDAGFFVVG